MRSVASLLRRLPQIPSLQQILSIAKSCVLASFEYHAEDVCILPIIVAELTDVSVIWIDLLT
jgi:hypothetical protein